MIALIYCLDSITKLVDRCLAQIDCIGRIGYIGHVTPGTHRGSFYIRPCPTNYNFSCRTVQKHRCCDSATSKRLRRSVVILPILLNCHRGSSLVGAVVSMSSAITARWVHR